MYGVHAHFCVGALRGQKRASGLLDLELSYSV